MKISIPQNLKTELHPFRQIAVTSFIKGGLCFILGVIILLTIKADFVQGNGILAIEKMISGLGLLALGCRSIWRGYKYEYDFSLSDVYDTPRGIKVNYLLGQRCSDPKKLAAWYTRIMRERAFHLENDEKGDMKDWQSVFYKLTSKKGISKLFDHLPYPITNFIANQSGPIALIGFCLIFMIAFLFISYLGIIPIDMIYINLAVLIGLLSWWQPSGIDSVFEKDYKKSLTTRILFFIIFYLITISIYRSYANSVNIGIMLSILVLAIVMIYTALLSFRLIDHVFTKRQIVNVEVSDINLAMYRVATQPNNIRQQFDNIMDQSIGWYYRAPTEDWAGLLAGDQNRKGEFTFEYVWETYPKIISTTYDTQTENQLSKIWKIGTLFLSLGLILFCIGILILPGVDLHAVRFDPENALSTYSPKILAGLYFILFGVALFFFGNKLVYEVYMFFNTEIFFESNLILFKASGNYDEFEQIIGGIKRKDTSTDFTPDVKICKVQSSVFVNPYMNKSTISTKPRFLLSVTRDEQLLENILGGFRQNMKPYIMKFPDNDNPLPGIDGPDPKEIE